MVTHSTHNVEPADFAMIDDVHRLRQRNSTRLWYREVRPQTDRALVAARPAARNHAIEENVPSAIPAAAQLAEIANANIAIKAGKPSESQNHAILKPEADEPSEPWLIVPTTCPTLMLAESPTLGGHVSNAQLSPGGRFRVVAITNGVAEIDVLNALNEVVRGYCNTVDLACAAPHHFIARSRSGKLHKPKSDKFTLASLSHAFGRQR